MLRVAATTCQLRPPSTLLNTVPRPLPKGATAQPCNASMKWKSVTPDSEALETPEGIVQVWPLSTERAIVPRSEISQPTLPSPRNWSRYQATVSLSAAAQVLPPSLVRTELPSSAIAMPSRLSKNQMLLRVAWATPPALRRFQVAPPSVLSQVRPLNSREDEALRAEGTKAGEGR